MNPGWEHPIETPLTIGQDHLGVRLMPLLVGSVFHVTRWTSYCSIRASGFVDTNADGRRPYSFHQTLPSFGVRRDFVCLFDLRSDLETVEERYGQDIRTWLDFLKPHAGCHRHAYLIIAPSACDELIPNSAAIDERGLYIPRIECWYPKALPLKLVSHVHDVTITGPPRPSKADTVADLFAQKAWNSEWGTETDP